MAVFWSVLQTYMKWANSILCERGVIVREIDELEDGRIFALLIGVLTSDEIEFTEADNEKDTDLRRIEAVLNYLKILKIDLRLSPHDILNGDMKSILDLYWILIVHFTIHTPNTPVSQRTLRYGKSRIMEWCVDQLTDAKFKMHLSISDNFKGTNHLAELIEKCCSIPSPDGQKREPSVERLTTALIAAEETLGIIKTILSPADVIHGTVNEYYIVIYLALLKRKVTILASSMTSPEPGDDVLSEPWCSLLHDTFSFKFINLSESLTDKLDLFKSSLAANASSSHPFRQFLPMREEGARAMAEPSRGETVGTFGGQQIKQEKATEDIAVQGEYTSNDDELLQLLETIGVKGQQMRQSLDSAQEYLPLVPEPTTGKHAPHVISRLIVELEMLRGENERLFQELAESRSKAALDGGFLEELAARNEQASMGSRSVTASGDSREELSTTRQRGASDGRFLEELALRNERTSMEAERITASGDCKEENGVHFGNATEGNDSHSRGGSKNDSIFEMCGLSGSDSRSVRPLEDLLKVTLEENEMLRAQKSNMSCVTRNDSTMRETLEQLETENAELKAKREELERTVERFGQYLEILQAQNKKLVEYVTGELRGGVKAMEELKLVKKENESLKLRLRNMDLREKGQSSNGDDCPHVVIESGDRASCGIAVHGRGEADGGSNGATTPGLPGVIRGDPRRSELSESETVFSDSDWTAEHINPSANGGGGNDLLEQRLRFNLQRGIRSPSLGSLIKACAVEGKRGEGLSNDSSECEERLESAIKRENGTKKSMFYTPQVKRSARQSTVSQSESKITSSSTRRYLHPQEDGRESRGSASSSLTYRQGNAAGDTQSLPGTSSLPRWRQLRYSKARTRTLPEPDLGAGASVSSVLGLTSDVVCRRNLAGGTRTTRSSSHSLLMSSNSERNRSRSKELLDGFAQDIVERESDDDYQPLPEQIHDHQRLAEVSPPRRESQNPRPVPHASVRVSLSFRNDMSGTDGHEVFRNAIGTQEAEQLALHAVSRTVSKEDSGILTRDSDTAGYIHRMLSQADQSCANSIINKYLEAKK